MTRLLAVLFAAVLAGASPAEAHDSRPLAVKIAVTGENVSVSWKAPPSVAVENAPLVTLAAPCRPLSGAARGGLEGRLAYACPKGLARVDIQYPYFNPSLSTVIRLDRGAGEAQSVLLAPDQSSWTPAGEPGFWSVARTYFGLGVEHILIGIDHILFIAGLLLLAGNLPRTLLTITSFTVAHSVTLALVALGVLTISIPAVEAVIALSIVFVAAEVARGPRDTLAWRRPALVSSVFGLLHGAGFAAALGEIGLPKSETLAALGSFNLGVEAGQLLIVSAAWIVVRVLLGLRARYFGAPTPFPAHAPKLAGYALGIVSAFWLVERTMSALA
jgi:hydrogenase/urease accessory protein HupE